MAHEPRFAIALTLTGGILESATTAQRLLRGGLGLSHLADHSPFPHVTMVAGGCSESAAGALMDVAAKKIPAFLAQACGLDVIGGDRPALIIRFLNEGPMADARNLLAAMSKDLWQPEEPSTRAEHWLPKASLAYGDLTQATIPPAFRVLNSLTFEGPMQVRRLALIAYGPRGERLVGVRSMKERAAKRLN
ncbi:MAG: hypothetical protein ACPGNT_07805 [Rhodospirillales bacterium]